VQDFKFKELRLPENCELPENVRNNIFMSEDALTNPNKLLLLIQGSGAVRPGQWARALCLNESLEIGSILPYLKKAVDRGYGVIVFNPNQTQMPKELVRPSREEFFIPGKPRPQKQPEMIRIPGHSSPKEHTLTIWDDFANKSAAKQIVIIAHSAGGVCTIQLLCSRAKEILPRLSCVAFTDSVHSVSPSDPKPVRKWLEKNAINWVQSDEPLDTVQKPQMFSSDGCPCVSAGHPKHEWTSGSAIESVWKYIDQKTTEV